MIAEAVPLAEESGVRAVAPAEGFLVMFEDGHVETFDCPLDAHDRMNEAHSGALHTARASDGAVTARPVPFDFLDLWRWGR